LNYTLTFAKKLPEKWERRIQVHPTGTPARASGLNRVDRPAAFFPVDKKVPDDLLIRKVLCLGPFFAYSQSRSAGI